MVQNYALPAEARPDIVAFLGLAGLGPQKDSENRHRQPLAAVAAASSVLASVAAAFAAELQPPNPAAENPGAEGS